MSDVGTQKVYEDERIAVWHFDLEPGQHGQQHTHSRNYVAHIVTGSTVEVFGPDGQSLYVVQREAGETVGFRIVDDQVVSDRPDSPAVPATHSAKNVGRTTFREVLIEFKS